MKAGASVAGCPFTGGGMASARRQGLQGVPPQAVDGAGGEGQPILQGHGHGFRPEGGAPGLLQPGGQILPGEGAGAGGLGDGAADGDGVAVPVSSGEGGGLSRCDLRRQSHGDGAQILPVVGGLGRLEQVSGLRGFLRPGAEHGGAGLSRPVALGEAVPGEGQLQLSQLLGGGLAVFPQQGGVDPGDDRHIFRPLHAALQLQDVHAHVPQLPQTGGQAGVLQAQGVAGPAAVHPVGQAAGLGAGAPVAAAPADEGAHGALAGPAHTQGPVGEDLDLDGAVLADIGDIPPAQLPAQHHAGHAQIGGGLHPVQGVDGHLGAAVEGQVRDDPPGQGRQAPVLDNDAVHAAAAGPAQILLRSGQLPVPQQGVEGQVDLYPPEVAVGHRLGQLLRGEVFRPPAGVELAAAQIHGVGPVLDGGHHGLPVAGRGEQLHHFLASCCCSLKISRLHSLSSAVARLASSR